MLRRVVLGDNGGVIDPESQPTPGVAGVRAHRDLPGTDAREGAVAVEAPAASAPAASASSGGEASGEGRVDEADLAAVAEQLGRVPRGVVEVAARCVCGRPTVVRTAPRLPDGTPFPTTYYLTAPGAVAAVSTLEANGVMAEMTHRLAEDPELAARYRAAHEDYLDRRAELGDVPEITGISAGGMPARVKCLHVLVGHALARGRGVNPLGDEALDLIADEWRPTRCTC
ncbi:hypothetical protein EDD28_0425 [Salana multivorans]|uniref:DUF501 domain-containing protein n=1 Tax=Salana multivorans TaxID=120377 RepID=A0A3N2D844_9MICO|nr:hypothetical protein EDD28_0425 [Salana multivorans]